MTSPIDHSESDCLVARFLDLSLPYDEWTHRAHLVAGLWHARRFGFGEALDRMRTAIRRFNHAKGVPTTPTRGYHETVTVLYMRIVAAYAAQHPAGPSPDADADRLVRLWGARDVPLRYYSHERLWSPEARAGFVEPDLAPLPEPTPAAPRTGPGDGDPG